MVKASLKAKTKKFSGHGSLTKSGKVRDSTPKIKGANRKSRTPIANNRRKADKRFRARSPVEPGQHYLDRGRRRG